MGAKSKPVILMMLVAKAVLFSTAFTVTVRALCLLFGLALTEHAVGNLLMLGSVLTGTTGVLLYSKAIKALESGEAALHAGSRSIR